MPVDEYSMWLERDRTGMNVSELQHSYDLLIQKVKHVDPLTIAETTDGRYKGGDGVPRVVIPFLQSWFVLDLLPYRIRAEHEYLDTLPLKVLVLHHILAASENLGTAVRVLGTWIDCRSLQHGAVLGAHFSRSVMDTLSRFFALETEQQLSRVLRWGGRPIDMADQGYRFALFPRLPVAFIHWTGDDEFAPFSKILYDVSASNYMPVHGLTALTEFLVYRLAED